jgi:transposase
MVSDAFLAARAAEGDQAAFAELARRYRPLMISVAIGPPPGWEIEDLRQEALLALLATCSVYDRAKGPFPALARRNVHRRVNNARHAARALKHCMLSDALRDGDEPTQQLIARIRAPEGNDPARMVELRDELRERAELARRPRVDRRRRYSDEQITHALALIREGYSIKQAAFVLGASRDQVARWFARSGLPRPRPRGYTPDEVRTAIALVHAGASQRAAAAAVGASKSTLQGWLEAAA